FVYINNPSFLSSRFIIFFIFLSYFPFSSNS
ncbi:hypothetical protein, partial [Plasmodium yoelii yoelii]